MKERGVDFILSPAYVGVAAELQTAQYWLYTGKASTRSKASLPRPVW